MRGTKDSPTILVTGAAGNLGGLLAERLRVSGHRLRLMVHRTPLAAALQGASGITPVQAVLAHPTLESGLGTLV